jgi:predicted acyltransferase
LIAAQPSNRLLSLDVFRGLVIAGMILVTDPGTYGHTFHQLRHADWNGATATDMIFPAFLFMVGVAIPYSFASQRDRHATRAALVLRIVRRAVVLFLLGLAVNGFYQYHWQTLRIPGILQRIAVCYLVCALIFLAVQHAPHRARILLTLAFSTLLIYAAILRFAPVPGLGAGHLDSYANFPAYVDRSVFGINHLWAYGTTPGRGVTYDSEGILSTLPALFTTLIGILAGNWIRKPPPRADAGIALALLLPGMALAVAGLALSPLMPLNKRILTPTFALFSTGVALIAFAVLYFVVDVRGLRRGLTPLLMLGTNAILAFVLSSVLTTLLAVHFVQNGQSQSPHGWANDHLFAPWLPPNLASLVYALVIVALNIALIYPLYRKRIFLRT